MLTLYLHLYLIPYKVLSLSLNLSSYYAIITSVSKNIYLNPLTYSLFYQSDEVVGARIELVVTLQLQYIQ